jgi:hypothetical protein
MYGQEEWQFTTARAVVIRAPGLVEVELHGVITAPVYEALHARLARETGEIWLLIGWPALLALTNRSAAEAAARGSPAPSIFGRMPTVHLCVPRAREQWARRHCELMNEHGLPRQVSSLCPESFQARRMAA